MRELALLICRNWGKLVCENRNPNVRTRQHCSNLVSSPYQDLQKQVLGFSVHSTHNPCITGTHNPTRTILGDLGHIIGLEVGLQLRLGLP